jgi:hypothetical protein
VLFTFGSSLQEDSKAKEDTAEQSSQAQTSVGHEDGASALVVVAIVVVGAAAAGRLSITETSGWDSVGGGTGGLCGGGHGGRERSVAAVRVLSTARVILTAGALAGSVVAAVVNTVVSPLLADEVGQGLGVFGDVGGDAVVADAVVGQVIRVAVVCLCAHGVDARLLETDERALSRILRAPVISGGLGDGVGVNCVWVVVLGSRLSSSEASEGGNAKGEDGTHGECRYGVVAVDKE